MFVTKSRYLQAERRAAVAEQSHNKVLTAYMQLLRKWNAVVDDINSGVYVLASRQRLPPPAASQFTAAEIEVLIRLCHPDRHANSGAANDMTAKLLALRKKG